MIPLKNRIKTYVVNKSKLEVLETLAQQIQASNEVQEGMSFFEGFEVLSTKTFLFNLEAVSIYRAILKVKEKGEKVVIESSINTNWYFEFSLFLGFLIHLLLDILITYNNLFHPIFNSKEPTHPAFWCFIFIGFFAFFLSIRKANSFKLKGQKAIDLLLEPLKN